MPIVFPAERNLAVGHADQARVGDGDAVGIAAEIGQHLLWSAEWRLGVDDPFDAADLGKSAPEGSALRQFDKVAEEAQPARALGRLQLLQKEPAEQARQNTHRQEEPWPAGDPTLSIKGDPAARHDAMDVGMVV